MSNDTDTTTVRPSSFIEEDIEISVSSELIPDEYEHTSNQNISAHFFHSTHDFHAYNADALAKTLKEIGYQISDSNVHNLDTVDCNKLLDEISSKVQQSDGLLLFFSAFYYKDETALIYNEESAMPSVIKICDVWQRFTSNKCPGLHGKPKIFIFQAAVMKSWTTDGRMIVKPPNYEIPSEADIIIIYNKTNANDDVNDFTCQVCSNIKSYGQSEDIISIITCTESDGLSRPLIISTMTRKFYFTVSPERGHHFYINDQYNKFSTHLRNIDQALSSLQGDADKKKSFFSFRGFTSFRKHNSSNKEKPKVERNENENANAVQNQNLSNERLTSSRKSSITASNSHHRKQSVSSTTGRPPWK